MSSNTKQNKGLGQRKRFRLIKKDFQIGAMLWVFAITVGVLAFHTFLTYQTVSGATELTRAALVRILLQDVGITVVLMTAFVFFIGIIGTHKVAGPLHRFQMTLKNLQKGDISDTVRLRDGDMLMDFQGDMNLAVANLREMVAEDRQKLDEARHRLTQLLTLLENPEKREVEETLKVLRTVTRKYKLTKDGEQARAGARRVADLPGMNAGVMRAGANPAGGSARRVCKARPVASVPARPVAGPRPVQGPPALPSYPPGYAPGMAHRLPNAPGGPAMPYAPLPQGGMASTRPYAMGAFALPSVPNEVANAQTVAGPLAGLTREEAELELRSQGRRGHGAATQHRPGPGSA